MITLLLLFISTVHCLPSWPGQHPIFSENCPDPGPIFNPWTNEWNIVCTDDKNLHGGVFPVWKSKTLQDEWVMDGNAFQQGVDWGYQDWWAPELHYIEKFDVMVIMYTARWKLNGKLVLGIGWKTQEMTYFQHFSEPIASCDWVGLIDGHLSRNQSLLVYKLDGNDVGKPSVVYGVEVDWKMEHEQLQIIIAGKFGGKKDLPNDSIELIRSDLPWEDGVVEAPWLLELEGWWYLFYSVSGFNKDTYATSVAKSKDIVGPYVKLGAPILYSKIAGQLDWGYHGPGHGSAIWIDGGLHFIYHAWLKDSRVVLMNPIYFFPVLDEPWPLVWRGNPWVDPALFDNVPLWKSLLKVKSVAHVEVLYGLLLGVVLYGVLAWYGQVHPIPYRRARTQE